MKKVIKNVQIMRRGKGHNNKEHIYAEEKAKYKRENATKKEDDVLSKKTIRKINKLLWRLCYCYCAKRYGVDSLEGAQRCSKLVFPGGKCSEGKGEEILQKQIFEENKTNGKPSHHQES